MLLVTPAHQVTLAAAPTTRNDPNEHIDPFGDPTAVAHRPPGELPRTPPELSHLHNIPCVLFFYGACYNRKGGGPGGSGAVIYRLDTEEEVCRASRPLELTTSNRAEYDALSLGLQLALDNGVNHLLDICGYSQLIIGQLDGSKQINSHEMKACHHTASGLLSEFTTPPRLHWIPRERNTVSVFFCLAIQPIMEEALEATIVKDVHAYCIADDINLAAEPEQLIRAAERLQKGLNDADLTVKKIDVLLGPRCRHIDPA